MVDAVTVTYAVGTLGMLVGVAIAVALLNGTDSGADGHFGYLVAIPGFAAVMYGLMTFGFGAVTIQGYAVPVPRYVDWLLTTPILVGYAAYVAGMGRRYVVGVAVADALMIAFGWVAVATAPPVRWVAFALSSLCHLSLLWVLYAVLPQYAAEQSSKRRRLADVLQNHVGLLWIAYPVIWVFGPGLELISAAALAMIITYLDVVAKVPYVYFVYRARDGFDGVTLSESARTGPRGAGGESERGPEVVSGEAG